MGLLLVGAVSDEFLPLRDPSCYALAADGHLIVAGQGEVFYGRGLSPLVRDSRIDGRFPAMRAGAVTAAFVQTGAGQDILRVGFSVGGARLVENAVSVEQPWYCLGWSLFRDMLTVVLKERQQCLAFVSWRLA
jgi:hypothetical protein